jgi:hypothetical protein
VRAELVEDSGRLTRECEVFTRYLVGRDPDAYVVRKYVEGQVAVHPDAPWPLPIDDALVRFASKGPFRARVADAYARLFRPRGRLRRKLILTFAILESSAGFHRDFTSGHGGKTWTAWWTLLSVAVAFGAALGLGIVVFGPRHVGGSIRRREPTG